MARFDFDAETDCYEAFGASPLGSCVEAVERQFVSTLSTLHLGDQMLDRGCGTGTSAGWRVHAEDQPASVHVWTRSELATLVATEPLPVHGDHVAPEEFRSAEQARALEPCYGTVRSWSEAGVLSGWIEMGPAAVGEPNPSL